jgi:hypothetical protein
VVGFGVQKSLLYFYTDEAKAKEYQRERREREKKPI